MKISQREARRMKRELEELKDREERRFSSWAHDYPGGTNFYSLTLTAEAAAAITVAQTLRHAMVARISNGTLRLYALPPTAET